MKKLLLFALCALSFSITAVAQQFHWAKTGNQYRKVATDKAGNVYMLGYATGVGVDVDPGPGVHIITPNPTLPFNHPYVVKLNKLGNFVWAFDLNSDTYSEDWDLAVDNAQNVYAVGRIHPDMFETYTYAFVRKINANGSQGWGIQYIGGNPRSSGRGVAVDSVGGVYVSGYATTPIDLDPGANDVQFSGGPFIVKYTSAGDYVWHVTGGGNMIKVSSDGNSIFTAEQYSSLVPNSIMKHDGNGAYIWGRTFDSTTIKDINITEAGKIYATGSFVDTVDMDPGAGVQELMTAGGTDQFLLNMDTAGAYVWATRMGSTSADEGVGVILDGDGHIYTSGSFSGTVDMDAGAGMNTLTSVTPDTSDIVVQKLDLNGTFVWAKPIASTWFDNILGMATDTAGSIIFIGRTAVGADFNPGTPVFALPATSTFVAKWSDTTVVVVSVGSTEKNEDGLVMYPNPSVKTINVAAVQTIDKITITDLAGRVVYTASPARKNVSVDILQPGVYFVSVTTGDRVSGSKVLIQ